MIHFANPQYLYFLIIIPIIAIIYVLFRIARKRRLNKFGSRLNDDLMPDVSKYLPNFKIILQLLSLALIILAASRPYVHTDSNVVMTADEESVNGIEVMICCDVSNSMLASATDDTNGVSRLQRAKFILDKCLNNMTDDRVGLVVFAGDAYLQMPLTPDVHSAKMYANDMNPSLVPLQGTAIGSAINAAVNAFDPESSFNKAIVIITDGENFEDDATAAAQSAAQAGIQVNVIGMGTPGTGMPIPTADSPTGFMVYNGEEVRTALDDAGASEIAKAGNGIYLSGNSNSVVSDLDNQLGKIKQTEYKRRSIPSDSTDLFPLIISFALFILLIDTILPYSKLKWLRNIKFFTKK